MIRLLVAAAIAAASVPPTPGMLMRDVAWTGKAHIHAGGKDVDIGVSTRLSRAEGIHSDSWLLSDGPSRTRSLVIGRKGAWTQRDGKSEPMPEPMVRHELEQYAIYALIQRAQLLGPELVRKGQDRVTLKAASEAPDTLLIFDKTGRLTEARDQVDDADGKGVKIDQIFRFSGEIADHGLAWPRRIEILQNGQPYFTLDIDTFTAGNVVGAH